MAVDPVARVVAPRFWGGVLSMPLLAALFSAMGIFGGYLVGVQLIGVDAGAFWSQMQAAVDLRNDIRGGQQTIGGIHLNAAGYNQWREAVLSHICSSLGCTEAGGN